MGRLSLPVVCLVVFLTAARAHAQQCSCGPTTVVPAWGAREVPLNVAIQRLGLTLEGARLIDGPLPPGASRVRAWDAETDEQVTPAPWPRGDAGYTIAGKVAGTPVQRLVDFDRLAPTPLIADHHYALVDAAGEVLTQFQTSSTVDLTIPAAPVIHRLRLSVPEVQRAGEELVEIDLDAAFDPDVAFVTFTLTTEAGQWWGKARPDEVRWLGRRACGTQLPVLQPGEIVQVRIDAIDLADNHSVAVEREVVVEAAAPREPGCAPVQPTHRQCALPPSVTVAVALALGVVVVIVFGVWGIAQLCWFGGVRRAPDEAEPISLLVVERLARRVQRRGGVITALTLVAGVPWFVHTEHGFLVIASTIVGVIGVRSLVMARAVLRLIETSDPRLSAEASERTLTVTLHHTVASLDVHARELDRARRHAVPTSFVRR